MDPRRRYLEKVHLTKKEREDGEYLAIAGRGKLIQHFDSPHSALLASFYISLHILHLVF